MSAQGVFRFGAGAIVVGGAIATAVILGSGTAHAAPGTDVVDIASATSGSDLSWLWSDAESLLGAPATSGAADAIGTTGSTDPLSTAVTDFTDDKSVLTGIDASTAPSDLQSSLTQNISSAMNLDDTGLQLINDDLKPVESVVLADTGPLSTVIDQWFFEPLNHSWATEAQALLTADQGLATAIAGGTESSITTALQDQVVADANFLPTEFESIPFMVVADLMGDGGAGDASAAPDFFDLPSGL